MTQNLITYRDAVCLFHAEMFGDLAIFKKEGLDRKQAVAICEMIGLNHQDPCDVDKEYSEVVDDLAAEILPDDWGTTFDFWGGKCFTRNPQWRAPKKDTVMAGESGRYLCCTSEQAIREELMRYKDLG